LLALLLFTRVVVVDSAAIFARRDDETVFDLLYLSREDGALHRSVRQERQDLHPQTHEYYVININSACLILLFVGGHRHACASGRNELVLYKKVEWVCQ
jgi:hypothetical protein